MTYGAQLTIVDLRGAVRHRVDLELEGHLLKEDKRCALRVRDLSAKGVLLQSAPVLETGERIGLLLPGIGGLEAHAIWSADSFTGLQFERILRLDELVIISDALQLNLPLERAKRRSAKIVR